MTSPAHEMTWMQVHWPSPFDAALARELLRRFASDQHRSPIVFEVRTVEGGSSHFVGTEAHQIRQVVGVIESLVPGTTTSPAEASLVAGRSVRLKLASTHLSLKVDAPAQSARAILGALAEARYRGESSRLQVVLGRTVHSRLTPAKFPDPTQSWWTVLSRGSERASTEITSSVRQRNSEVGCLVVVRAFASAQSDGRKTAILRGIVAALRTTQSHGTGLKFVSDDRHQGDSLRLQGATPLATSEILSLIGFPLDAENLPGMPDPHPKLLRLENDSIDLTRVFAVTNAPGTAKPVGIAISDALYHSIIIGPTGSGKSTLMLNLIVADLLAKRGGVVIDPKSDLVRDILERIPEDRKDDIVVLDPTQLLPVGLNPLATPGTSPELIADAILGIFRDLFPSAFGPRTSDVMYASLLTLASNPGSTLTWIPRLLTDARFRKQLTDRLDDPDGLEAFWDQFNELSERQQAQHIGPVLSRLRQFLLRPSLKRILDQSEPKFSLSQIFDENKVLLVPLNSGLIGNDAARLLGSLLVSQLWQLTLGRASLPIAERTPISIYIDEVQEYLRLGGGSDLNDALARSRSLGVAWHAAHQYRKQLPVEMRSAFDANARNKVVYAVGVDDAKAMAAMTANLSPEDFMKLPPYAVYANLMRSGEQTGWFSAQANAAPPRTSDPIEIIARSQARYGAEVHESPPPAPRDENAPHTTRNSNDDPSDPRNTTIGRKKRTK